MRSKFKAGLIFLLELPLVLVGVVIKFIIAFLAILYIRWVQKGIAYGRNIHTKLESHELGYIKEKKRKK